MKMISKVSNFIWMVVFFTCVILLIESVHADEPLRAKENWTMEDVKKFLELPYEKNFDTTAKVVDFKILDDLRGISGSLIIPTGLEFHETKWAQFRICTSDMSIFRVSILRNESCKVACDLILQLAAGLYPQPAVMVGRYFHSYDITGDVYRLIGRKRRQPRIWYLDLRKGILIDISYDVDDQILTAPTNKDVLIKQMELIAEGLIATFDAQEENPKNVNEYYKKLKTAYSEVVQRGTAVTNVPANATKFDLFLSEVPPEEKADTDIPFEIKKLKKVISHKPYLVSRVDGKALVVVKIADPNKVNADVLELEDKDTDVSDVLFQQVTHQGKPAYVEASLRPDGQYEVRFYGVGKQVLRVLYLDNKREVIEFGEVEIEVEAASD